MEPGGSPWLRLGCLRTSSAWEPTEGFYSPPGPRLSSGWRTRPEVALTSQPGTHSVRPTGSHGNDQRDPGLLGAGTPTPRRMQDFPPSAPTTPRPQTHGSPLPLKWIRPLPADLNAERSISSVLQGSGARALLGPGDDDHPPLQAAASRRPRSGRWA